MKILKSSNELTLITNIFNYEENVNMMVYDIGALHRHHYGFGRMSLHLCVDTTYRNIYIFVCTLC